MDGKLQQFAREMFQSSSAFRDLYCELGEGELGIYFTVLQTTARSLCAGFFFAGSLLNTACMCAARGGGKTSHESSSLSPRACFLFEGSRAL